MNDNTVKSNTIYSSVKWSMYGQAGTEILRFGLSVVMARLLTPDDFGLIAMAGVVIGFLSIFRYLGTSDVIIQRKELSQTLLSSLFYVNVILGTTLSLAIYFSGPFLAEIYEDVRVGGVIQVLGLSFIISSFGMVQRSLLTRTMEFNKLIPINLIAIVAQATVAITLGSLGYHVWALVFANLANATVDTIVLWRFSKWRPSLICKWSEIKEVVGFSMNVTGAGIIHYFTRNTGDFVIGRWIGATALGFYSLGYRLYLYPLNSITRVLMRVFFPTFSRQQDDDAELCRTFVRLCGGIAMVTFPLMIGIAVLAKPLVLTLYGEKWAEAIPIIIILAPIGMLQSLATPTGRIYIAKGRADLNFRWMLISGLFVVGAFFVGLNWGVLGVVTSYAIVMLPVTLISFYLAFYILKHPISMLIKALQPYFVATFVMGGLVYGLRYFLDQMILIPQIIMAVCVPFGVIVYIIMILYFKPPALYDMGEVIPGGKKILYRWFRK